MTDTTNANGRGPRHMGPTREVPLVGYRPKHDAENKPRDGGAHLKADVDKPVVWPLADADPTRRVQAQPPTLPPAPRHPAPNVVIDTPMTAKDARKVERILLWALVVGVPALVAVLIAFHVAGRS